MATEPQAALMPNDQRESESGQFASKYPDETFLSALNDLGEAGTRDVAEHVGCDRDTARRRLTALAESSDANRRKIAGAILWSRTGESADDGTEARA